MWRELFKLEKFRQSVVCRGETCPPVKVPLHFEHPLAKGRDIVAGQGEAVLGIEHIHNGVEGVRVVQDWKGHTRGCQFPFASLTTL